MFISLCKHVQHPSLQPPQHLVASSLAAMSSPVLIALFLALAQGTFTSDDEILYSNFSAGAPQQMQTLPGGVGAEMSSGCSSGGCSSGSRPWQTLPMPMQRPSSSGSRPWQTLPMPMQRPMWQQPWQTLPMPMMPQGQAMSMEPQLQEVPRYGSVGDNLNHIRHIEVLPQHQALRGMAPPIQSAMPRYANWNTLPMQFNRQPPYAGGALEQPRQSSSPEGPEDPHKPDMTAPQPHLPDMTAPQPPVQTLPMPWTRSYTPIGNSGRCFNQCRNRYNVVLYTFLVVLLF